jgi:hypothetical protein
MRLALLALPAVGLALGLAAAPARGDALRQTVSPMMRADGAVCDLLRAQASDQCRRVANQGSATVYQSGTTAAGIHRLVLAIDTGAGVLVSPAVDLVAEQLQSTTPTLRSVAIDGRPGVVLEVVSTWKRGQAAQRTASLVGCSQVPASAAAIWKCALIELGSCDPQVAADGSVTTSCGARSTLSIAAR